MQAVDVATKVVQEGVESLGSVLGAGGIELTPFAAGIVLALGLFMLTAAFPTTGTIWTNITKTINGGGSALGIAPQALALLPALSVLMLPSPSYEAYAMSGLLFTLLGYGIMACIPAAKEANDGQSTKLQLSASYLGTGLGTAGASFFVGAIAAYAVTYGRSIY